MVRLRPRLKELQADYPKLFQSHYGAIATPLWHNLWKPNGQFQSHYGAIATNVSPTNFTQKALPFQSHYGAIATSPCARNLKPRFHVSIPLWCDCDQGDIKLLKCLASVNGLSLFRLYSTTFFPFCQIGKVGKVANFAANLRLPLRPWGVDGKRSKRKVGGIFGKFGLG